MNKRQQINDDLFKRRDAQLQTFERVSHPPFSVGLVDAPTVKGAVGRRKPAPAALRARETPTVEEARA